METIYYLGLDVHKKTIACCIKTVSGMTMRQGVISAPEAMNYDNMAG